MWIQKLHGLVASGGALPNAIREALPDDQRARVEAGTTLLMAALSMPDTASVLPRVRPRRVAADSLMFGDSLFRIVAPPNREGLSMWVFGISAQADAAQPPERFDLADFVGQSMMLRAIGEHDRIEEWLKSYLET